MAAPVARLGVMRLGASRLGVFQPWSKVLIAGIDRSEFVRIAGAGVEQVLNHEPDTVSFRVDGHDFTPIQGQEVKLQFGDATVGRQLFGGHIQQVKTVYELNYPANIAHDCECVDYTWTLNKRKVTAHFLSMSATDIVLAVIAGWTTGFTTTHVVEDLPQIDEITFTNEDVADALSRIAERIGGYWFVDYAKDIHFFLSEDTDTITVSDAGGSMDGDTFDAGAFDTIATSSGRIISIEQSVDISRVITRVLAQGGGSNAAIEVPAGSTELPVQDGAWYSTTGGEIKTDTQRVSYTGLRGATDEGAIVGAGNSPTNPPNVTHATGTSHTAGAVYQYAVTFVTGTGETLPSPIDSFTPSGGFAPAPSAPTARDRGVAGGVLVSGGSYKWALTIGYAGGGLAPGAASGTYVVNSNKWEVYVDPAVFTTDPKASFVNIYRTVNGGSTLYAETSTTSGGWVVVGEVTDAAISSGATLPTSNTAELRAGRVDDIPISANTAVTSRKVYRTVANGSQLKLLTTIADNTTTTYLDQTVDGSLGANVPTTDTAGMTDNRQVGQGETALPVSSTVPFAADGGASGGWVRVGNLAVRYTGISGNNLTGIPTSGLGALTATVRYGTQVLVMPRLVGVTGVTETIAEGAQVNVFVERNDVPAQTALAAIMGGDGIIEEVIVDGRLSEEETRNRADALLAERKDPHVTLVFTTRHPGFVVGRTVTFSLTTPAVTGTYQIQSVRITELQFSGAFNRVFPLRTVEASSRRFTFEDFLRQIRQAVQRRG